MTTVGGVEIFSVVLESVGTELDVDRSGRYCHVLRHSIRLLAGLLPGLLPEQENYNLVGEYVVLVSMLLTLWSHPPGLNRRPADYESAALPAELGWPVLILNNLRTRPRASWIQLDSIGLPALDGSRF